jgi:hypothetical protein
MKVKFKRGWWRTYGTLTPGNVYRVIAIEADQFRILDDVGGPVLFARQAFQIVDPNEAPDWISKRDEDGDRYAHPAKLSERYLFERWHDDDKDARAKLKGYMLGLCWQEAHALEESANFYLRVRWKHERPDMPIDLYSELDEERWEVRKVEVFRDGRLSYAEGRSATGDTRLGEVPVPALEQIAADPEFEPSAISRVEFDAIWERAAYSDLDEEDRPA